MKHFFEDYSCCPKCGRKYIPYNYKGADACFVCDTCKYSFYQSSRLITSAIIPKKSNPYQVMFVVRTPDKHNGRVVLPCTFLVYDEKPETGVQRELEEDLGINLKIEKLFQSELSSFAYQERLMSVLFLYYLTEPTEIVPILGNMQEKRIVTCDFFDIRNLLEHKEKFAFSPDFKTIKKYLHHIDS